MKEWSLQEFMKDSQILISHQQKASCLKNEDRLIHFKINENEFLLKHQIDLEREIIILDKVYLEYQKHSNDQCSPRHDKYNLDKWIWLKKFILKKLMINYFKRALDLKTYRVNLQKVKFQQHLKIQRFDEKNLQWQISKNLFQKLLQ